MESSAAYMEMMRRPVNAQKTRGHEVKKEFEDRLAALDVYHQFNNDPRDFRAAFRHWRQPAVVIIEELAQRGVVAETPQQKKNLDYVVFQAQFEIASGLAALDKMPVPGHRQHVETLYKSNGKETELNAALDTLTVPEFYDAVQKMAETVRSIPEVFDRHDAGLSYIDEKPQEIDTSAVEQRFHQALDRVRGLSSETPFVSAAEVADFWQGQPISQAALVWHLSDLYEDLRKPDITVDDAYRIAHTCRVCLFSLEQSSEYLMKYAASSETSFPMRPSELQVKAEDAAETLSDSYATDVRASNHVFDEAVRQSREARKRSTNTQFLDRLRLDFTKILTRVEQSLEKCQRPKRQPAR